MVVDLSGRTNVATVAVVGPPYPTHAITERFDLLTVFPLARAITAETAAGEGRTPQPFLQTHQRSWAETTMSQLEDPDSLKPEEDKGDIVGPVTIGMAVAVPSKPPAPLRPATPRSRISRRRPRRASWSSATPTSPSNAYLGGEGNRDLFMNDRELAGAAGEPDLDPAARGRRSPADADGEPDHAACSRCRSSWCPAPILGAGVYTWWRRR